MFAAISRGFAGDLGFFVYLVWAVSLYVERKTSRISFPPLGSVVGSHCPLIFPRPRYFPDLLQSESFHSMNATFNCRGDSESPLNGSTDHAVTGIEMLA